MTITCDACEATNTLYIRTCSVRGCPGKQKLKMFYQCMGCGVYFTDHVIAKNHYCGPDHWVLRLTESQVLAMWQVYINNSLERYAASVNSSKSNAT